MPCITFIVPIYNMERLLPPGAALTAGADPDRL